MVQVLAADLAREASALAVAAGCSKVEPVLNCWDGILVYADPVQIQQVLMNLIGNVCEAVESLEAPEVLVCIEVNARDEVQFIVEDNRPGIDVELLPTIFDACVTTKDEGRGIGLAVSRTIIEAGGGRLWAENKAQGGATFSFTIPPQSTGSVKRNAASMAHDGV